MLKILQTGYCKPRSLYYFQSHTLPCKHPQKIYQTQKKVYQTKQKTPSRKRHTIVRCLNIFVPKAFVYSGGTVYYVTLVYCS